MALLINHDRINVIKIWDIQTDRHDTVNCRRSFTLSAMEAASVIGPKAILMPYKS